MISNVEDPMKVPRRSRTALLVVSASPCGACSGSAAPCSSRRMAREIGCDGHIPASCCRCGTKRGKDIRRKSKMSTAEMSAEFKTDLLRKS